MRHLLCCVALFACVPNQAEAPPVALEVLAVRAGVELRIVPGDGARINARLKPTLELDDGGWITFDSAHLTADSAYYAAPPVAIVALTRRRLAGTLRVGVCPSGLSVCQTVALRVARSL